jgi:hypothetical protein
MSTLDTFRICATHARAARKEGKVEFLGGSQFTGLFALLSPSLHFYSLSRFLSLSLSLYIYIYIYFPSRTNRTEPHRHFIDNWHI